MTETINNRVVQTRRCYTTCCENDFRIITRNANFEDNWFAINKPVWCVHFFCWIPTQEVEE